MGGQVISNEMYCINLNSFDTLFDVIGKNSAELAALNESLQDLLDGIQVMSTTLFSPLFSFVLISYHKFKKRVNLTDFGYPLHSP